MPFISETPSVSSRRRQREEGSLIRLEEVGLEIETISSSRFGDVVEEVSCVEFYFV
jgi:hypothetical protein